jgi:hypothetical protein
MQSSGSSPIIQSQARGSSGIHSLTELFNSPLLMSYPNLRLLRVAAERASIRLRNGRDTHLRRLNCRRATDSPEWAVAFAACRESDLS